MVRLRRTLVGEEPVLVEPPILGSNPILGAAATKLEDPPTVGERWTVEAGERLNVLGDESSGLLLPCKPSSLTRSEL